MKPEKRPPARRERLVARMHARFVRQLVGFARVAAEARRHDVFPTRAPALVARRDVVQVELGLGQDLGAILAGEFVPQEDIAAGREAPAIAEKIQEIMTRDGGVAGILGRLPELECSD